MKRFEKIRNNIGKDLKIKLPKKNGDGFATISFDWEFIINIDNRIFKVSDEFRKNDLSLTDSQYTLIYLQGKEGRIYPNIHDYLKYVDKFFKTGVKVVDYDFIYVWDKIGEELIVLWEYDNTLNYDNCKMKREFERTYFKSQYEEYAKSYASVIFD